MFNKKEFSKIYLSGFFILLIIISIFSVIIFEKTTDNNNQTIKLNLDTKVDEDLSWNFSTTNSVGIATTTGWTGSSQLTKSVSVGSTGFPLATFVVGIDTTSSTAGKFTISLGSTATRTLNEGRYVYDVIVSSGATVYKIVDGTILVQPGISSAL